MRDGANIRAIGDLLPDYMGFIFVPSSPRYAGHKIIPEARTLPASVTRVGVFRNAPVNELSNTVERYTLGAAQLHGDEDAGYVRELRQRLPSLLIIKAIQVTSVQDIAALSARQESPDLYLLDSGAGGTGLPFEWAWLAAYTASVPFLLAGGIALSNIDEALTAARRHTACVGIDINSRFETSPGIKNVEEIRGALTKVRI
jgi:phosphoribosylanthranilate isomerase